jgi:hypothetical protein
MRGVFALGVFARAANLAGQYVWERVLHGLLNLVATE